MTDRPDRSAHHPLTAGLAVLAGLAVATAAVAASSEEHHPAVLRLSGAATQYEKAATSDVAGGAGAAMAPMPMAGTTSWHHSGDWPVLPANAKVYRLRSEVLASADAERIAAALGVVGRAQPLPQAEAGSWQVSSGAGTQARTVTVSHSPGGNEVSLYAGGPVAVASDSGSTSAGGAGVVAEPGATPEDATAEPRPAAPPTEATVAPPPAPTDVPDAARAERIARDIVRAVGVGDDWTADVTESSSAVCASATTATDTDTPVAPAPDATDPCAATANPTVTGRFVTLHRVVDGTVVDGLDWFVDIGDHGVVTSASGTLGAVEALDEYPLRSAQSAYDDLVNGRVVGGGAVVPMAKSMVAIDAMPCRIDPAVPGGCLGMPEADVTITSAAMGLQRWFGTTADDAAGALIVPVYRLSGTQTLHWSGADAPADEHSDYSITVLAMDETYVAGPQSTTTVAPPATGAPVPVPAGPDDPAPTEPVEPVEPGPGTIVEPGPGTIVEPVPGSTEG